MSSFLNNSASKGLRNNNPGNIRRSSDNWQGKIPHSQSQDAEFEQFYEIKWGLRALMIDLRTKINKGLNTLNKIINVYAPPSENNTQAYIANVADWTGYGSNQVLNVSSDVLVTLAKAFVRMELGANYASKITLSDWGDAKWLVETGAKYGDDTLPELTITGKTCKYCGHVLAIIVCFFLSCYSVSVVTGIDVKSIINF